MKSLRYSIICIFLFFLVSCNRKISFSILKVSWNDNGERKDSFMEYYRSQLKDTPELGWNIMLMDGHANSGIILPPHMVVIYVRDDGLIDFSHYTSDKVVPPRIGWTIEEMTDMGKGNYDRFGYSNFKYLPLGK